MASQYYLYINYFKRIFSDFFPHFCHIFENGVGVIKVPLLVYILSDPFKAGSHSKDYSSSCILVYDMVLPMSYGLIYR